MMYIKTHNSELRGQEAAATTELVIYKELHQKIANALAKLP